MAFWDESAYRSGSGMVHSIETTSANVSDIVAAHKLIREDDEFVNADAGYVAIEKREEVTKDERLSKITWRINKRKENEKCLTDGLYKEAMKHLSWVGQPRWTVYQGIAKNGARLYMAFAMAKILRWS